MIKIHDNNPIGLEINNIQVPAYKLARYLNKRLHELIEVPYTYATKNLKEVAQDLTNIQINNQHTMTTLDIKDLYVKLPIQDILFLWHCGPTRAMTSSFLRFLDHKITHHIR